MTEKRICIFIPHLGIEETGTVRTTLFFIPLAMLLSGILCAQDPHADYMHSVDLFDKNVRDSALFLAQRAVGEYDALGKYDSALLATILVSRNETILNTLEVAAKTMSRGLETYAPHLADTSQALLKGIMQRGEILNQNFQMDSALYYFDIVQKRLRHTTTPTALEAHLRYNMAFCYMQKREYDTAKQYALTSLRESRVVYGPDARETGNAVHVMCTLYNYSSQYDSALIYGREMLRLTSINYPADHPNIGVAHNELGTIYQNLCRYDSAVYHRKKCEEIFYKNYLKEGQGRYLAVAYGNLGYLYATMGEYELAQEYSFKALRLAEQQYGTENPVLIPNLTGIADNYQVLGNPREGLAYIRRAYRIQKKSGPREWGSLAYVENFLSTLFESNAQYDSAKYYAALAMSHYAQANMGDNKISVNAISSMGKALLQLGDTLGAERYFKDAAARFESFHVPWHENVVNLKLLLAQAARKHGYHAAQQALDAAFRSASLAHGCGTTSCILDSLFVAGYTLGLFQEQISLLLSQEPYKDPVALSNTIGDWIGRYETQASRYMGQLRSDFGLRTVMQINHAIYDAGVRINYDCWKSTHEHCISPGCWSISRKARHSPCVFRPTTGIYSAMRISLRRSLRKRLNSGVKLPCAIRTCSRIPAWNQEHSTPTRWKPTPSLKSE